MVCAHPDDESTGCGGTLRAHVVAGDDVQVINLTSGQAGGHGIEEAGRVREREAAAAAEIIGVGEVEFWREPDGHLRAGRRLADRLARELKRRKPDRVYTTYSRDMHPDHRAAARLVRAALERTQTRTIALQCEIWTPLEEIDEVVDISDHLDIKLRAIRAFASQCEVMRLDDAFEGLARYRGEMHSWPGGDYAEIFALLRAPVR